MGWDPRIPGIQNPRAMRLENSKNNTGGLVIRDPKILVVSLNCPLKNKTK
jgi:hypothetical protein